MRTLNVIGSAALLLAVSGCAGTRQQASDSPNPTTREVASAQRQSQEALKRAQDAQNAAADQAKKAAQAQAQVREDQRKLAEDQATARQEQAKAQQLQASAQQQLDEAASESKRHQQAASQGLSQQMQQSARGRQLAQGVVTEVRPDEIVIQPPSGDAMNFRLTDQTQVQIAGSEGTADEIREGAEARVSYENSTNGPTAVSVTVNPSGAAGPSRSPSDREGAPRSQPTR